MGKKNKRDCVLTSVLNTLRNFGYPLQLHRDGGFTVKAHTPVKRRKTKIIPIHFQED